MEESVTIRISIAFFPSHKTKQNWIFKQMESMATLCTLSIWWWMCTHILNPYLPCLYHISFVFMLNVQLRYQISADSILSSIRKHHIKLPHFTSLLLFFVYSDSKNRKERYYAMGKFSFKFSIDSDDLWANAAYNLVHLCVPWNIFVFFYRKKSFYEIFFIPFHYNKHTLTIFVLLFSFGIFA